MLRWISWLMYDWRRILRERQCLNEPIEEGSLRQKFSERKWRIFSRQVFCGRVLLTIWNVVTVLVVLLVSALIWAEIEGLLPERVYPPISVLVTPVMFIVAMSLCFLRVTANALIMALDVTNPRTTLMLSYTPEP